MISYCEENINSFRIGGQIEKPLFKILNKDFFYLSSETIELGSLTFFLINPPYFKYNPNRKSVCEDRNVARFFEEGLSVLDVLVKIDEISIKGKVAGLILYRVDQVRKNFREMVKKYRNIKISTVFEPRLNGLTRLIYFES